jgi:hypothetical protein
MFCENGITLVKESQSNLINAYNVKMNINNKK